VVAVEVKVPQQLAELVALVVELFQQDLLVVHRKVLQERHLLAMVVEEETHQQQQHLLMVFQVVLEL
jgi:hypothetical protein